MSEPTSDSPILAGVDPLIGQEIGGAYRLVRVIGAGGMGTVYEARHVRLNKRCAVKVLLHDLQADATYLERFRREAEVTSRLKNRHICEVLDFSHLGDGSLYLAMEFLEGEDLASRIRRRPLAPRELAPIIEGISQALTAAHSIGVIHRDIKPANIFIARTPEGAEISKLLDFGAAKRVGQDTNLTASGQVLGSVWYVSPEQARGQELDPRTDIFSLGIVIFEALTGKNPFEAASPTDTLFRIVSDPAPPLRSLQPALPAGLDEVLQRALAKRREERFATVADFAEALLPVLDATRRRPLRGSDITDPSLPARPGGRPTELSPGPRGAENRPASPGASTQRISLQLLVERGVLTPAQQAQAQIWETHEGELVFDRLVQAGFIEERALLRFVAGSSGFKYITAETLAKSRLPSAAVAHLPADLAESRCVAPLAFNPVDGQLTVAVAEPSAALLEEVRARGGATSVQGILALRGTIRAAIRRFYPAEALSPAALQPTSVSDPRPQPLAPPPGETSRATADAAPARDGDTLPPQVSRSPTLRTDPVREPEPAPAAPDAAIVEPLMAAGLLTTAALEQARAIHRERGGFLGDALLRQGSIKEVDFLRTFAELYGTQFVKSAQVVKVTFDEKLLEALPVRTAEELRVLPFSRRPATNEVHVIAAVPLNPEIESRVKALMDARAVTIYLATPGAVQAALRRWYYGDSSALAEVTSNGAGPGPMRPRSTPGAGPILEAEPEPERDASQKTVQVAVDPTQNTPGPAEVLTGARAALELQRRLTLAASLRTVLETFAELQRLESAALLLTDGREEFIGLRESVGERVPRARVEAVLASRQPLHTLDARADALLSGTRLVGEKRVVAALTLPLLGRRRVLGVLHVDATAPIADVPTLCLLAELVALRIDDLERLGQLAMEVREGAALDRFLSSRRASERLAPPEAARVQATVLCAELREPDELAGRLSAPELVAELNAAFTAIAQVVFEHGGAIAEQHGRRLVALWSPALGSEGDAKQAVQAALALQRLASTLRLGKEPAGLRLGLQCGPVTLGKLGPADRADFSVLGLPVRMAARLARLAQEGQVLASEAVLTRAGPDASLKPVPVATVRELGPAVVAYLIGASTAVEVELGKG
jgi:serine/threonine protein kinase/class 3 adenylate cyclase